MSNNVKTICPYCGHVEEDGEVKRIGEIINGAWVEFQTKINNKWMPCKTEGRLECGKCKREFMYRLTDPVVVLTSRLDWRDHDRFEYADQNVVPIKIPDTSGCGVCGATGMIGDLCRCREKELHLTGANNPTVPIED